MMKKLRMMALLFAAVFVGMLFCVKAEAADVTINATNFPDATFRAYVKKNFDKNGNGKLSAAEIKAVKSISVSNKGIKDLKGIERFTNLETLFCDGNKLTTLNLSKNTKLKTLHCRNNKLTALNISTLKNLYRVRCEGNSITKLNISKNWRLERAYHHPEDKWTDDGVVHYVHYDWDAPMSDYDLEDEEDIGDMAVDYELTFNTSTKIVVGPKITSPVWNTAKSATAGKKVTLTVKASGSGLKYQWYYKKPGSSSFVKVSAAAGKKASYTFTVAARHVGYTYICKVTDSNGTTTSREIYLKVNVTPKITSPTKASTKTVAKGKTATFTVKATGALFYQWQYRTSPTGAWRNVQAASGRKATYKLTVAASHNGYQYRCEVTNDSSAVVYSKIITLKVN